MPTLPSVTQNGIRVVYIRDVRLIEEKRIESVWAELSALVSQAAEDKMLLNFRNVKFMGSAMIGKLIQLSKRCKETQLDLRFCELNGNLLEVFELMKLTKVLKIHGSEAEGIESFKTKK